MGNSPGKRSGGHELGHRGAALRVGHGGHVAGWFMQHDGDGAAFQPHGHAVDGNLVDQRVHLAAQLGDYLAVHRHAPGRHEILRPATGLPRRARARNFCRRMGTRRSSGCVWLGLSCLVMILPSQVGRGLPRSDYSSSVSNFRLSKSIFSTSPKLCAMASASICCAALLAGPSPSLFSEVSALRRLRPRNRTAGRRADRRLPHPTSAPRAPRAPPARLRSDARG